MQKEDAYLNMMLWEYRERLRRFRQELRGMPDGHLSRRKCGDRYLYTWMRELETGRKTMGIQRDQAMISKLARKKYLQIAIKLLEEEIDRLTEFAKVHVPPEPAAVFERLPKIYRDIPEKMFFGPAQGADLWASQPYEANHFRPEEMIHVTSRGLRVRSKSELIIAEKLDQYEIPYRYEQMLHFENHSFSPDFTILPGRKPFYWEHCGMMGVPQYRRNNRWKIDMYERAGIVPWKNLIITYDMEDGGINSGIIESGIVNRLLPEIYG